MTGEHERKSDKQTDTLKRILYFLTTETFFVIVTFFVVFADVMHH